MAQIKKLAKDLAKTTAETNVGDIATVAGLLEKIETLAEAGKEANLPNLHAAAEAVGELVKKIIMDAVPDVTVAFETVKKAVSLLEQAQAKADIASLDEFPPELNLQPPPEAGTGAPGAENASELVDEAILAEFYDQNLSALEEMESLVLQLEKTQNPDALAAFRRYIHTIKGESGFIGLPEIEKVCHATENFLEESDPPYDTELVLNVVDWLSAALKDLSSGNAISRDSGEMLASLAGGAPAPGDPAGNGGAAQPAAAKPAAEPVEVATPEGGVWVLTGDASLLADFISESKEHLEVAGAELLNLESDPSNQEAMNSVFRAFHTIKGISSFLELEEIMRLAHDAENLLDLVRKGTLQLSHGVIDIAFESLDLMGELITSVKTALEADGTMATSEALVPLLTRILAASSGEEAPQEPVEPTDSKLGDLLVDTGAVSEADVNKVLSEEQENPTGKKLGELLVESKKVPPKEVAEALRRQNAEKAPSPQTGVELKETIRVDYERLENMVDTIGELVIAEAMITQDEQIVEITSELLSKKLHNFRMISRKLQELGTTIRMVPIAGTFQKMARLVRDLSKKSGKNINFHTVGDETELDRAYVDKIGDPLVHMIRNSVDHGIELPKDRAGTGKPDTGQIELRAYYEGGNIIIEISDDGRGINTDAVRAKAIEREIITEEEHLTEQEMYQLLFRPGFSTAAQVTEISGRGVGMDVVKRNIEELRGQINVSSEMGKGSVFKLILPLTLALIDGMVVRVGPERYIFPVLSVVESFRATKENMHTLMGQGEMISLRDRQLPFYRLSHLFEVGDANRDATEGLVVVLENNGREMGILVDDLVGLQQTVIKSLGKGMGETEGLAGGAIMADGQIGLIVDVQGLFKVAGKML